MEKEKFNIILNHIKTSFEQVTAELVDVAYKSTDTFKIDSIAKVAIIIGISGKSKGRILLQGSLETTNEFALAMNFGDPFEDTKEMYFNLAEFANMFCGRATTLVNNEFNEREFWLTPPAIFSGEELELITPKIQSEMLYYTGNQGYFLIDVGFEGD